MPNFVDLGIISDAASLANDATDALATAIPGYVPSDANLEVIVIEAAAPMAANAANVAAQVPAAIFRQFGTQLLGVQYQGAAYATASTTWTITDILGHTIPQGTTVVINGNAYATQADFIIAPGGTAPFNAGPITVVASLAGEAGNLQTGSVLAGTLALAEALSYVSNVATLGPSSGGADAETDSDYQNRLAAALALMAPRPITATDYPVMAANTPGVSVGRATSIDGYSPTVGESFTGTTTNASATLSAVSSFTGLGVGLTISGAGIPANTTILSLNTGASTLLMSANATASYTAEAITTVDSYSNLRTVTTWVTDEDGNAFSDGSDSTVNSTKYLILQYLQAFREANFLLRVLDPDYTSVNVTLSSFFIVNSPQYTPASVQAAVEAAITAYLNAAQWGKPTSGDVSSWTNINTVRYTALLGVIEDVAGVSYVPNGALTINSLAANTDLVLTGPTPLPETGTLTIPLPTVGY